MTSYLTQDGKQPTGILLPSIKNSGFKNVADFLDTAGTDKVAKMLQKTSPTPPPTSKPKAAAPKPRSKPRSKATPRPKATTPKPTRPKVAIPKPKATPKSAAISVIVEEKKTLKSGALFW